MNICVDKIDASKRNSEGRATLRKIVLRFRIRLEPPNRYDGHLMEKAMRIMHHLSLLPERIQSNFRPPPHATYTAMCAYLRGKNTFVYLLVFFDDYRTSRNGAG
jgi:hypothetical protein